MSHITFESGLSSLQLELSNTIRRLWNEHVLWTRLSILSTAFSLPDLQFVSDRLLQNPNDFANALKPFYGNQTAMQFNQLLKDHLLIAAQLVNAAKAGDTVEVDKQRRRWYANAEDIAIFLASINTYWSQQEWKELLFEHLRMTENEAVSVLTGQYQKGIEEYDSIQEQALTMADKMTLGILRQFRV